MLQVVWGFLWIPWLSGKGKNSLGIIHIYIWKEKKNTECVEFCEVRDQGKTLNIFSGTGKIQWKIARNC